MNVVARWRCNRWLRSIDRVGTGARLKNRPYLANHGRISIGDDFFLSSEPVQSHIEALPGATIDIGDRVFISYGAAIASQREIRIGNDTKLGPFVVIMDNDFHLPGNRDASGDVAPVLIGAHVNVGARVTILRGADIGDGVRVLSGSTVSGVVPGGVTVYGVPARVLNDGADTDIPDIPKLIRSVLGLARRPEAGVELKEIPGGDGPGTRRLALAINQAYGIALREEELRATKTLAALCDLVELAIERSCAPPARKAHEVSRDESAATSASENAEDVDHRRAGGHRRST
jgi:acetyltransferase-like isoleucine patch superfamily enzyme